MVAVHLITFVWPRPDLGTERFTSYWRDVHGPRTVSTFGRHLRSYSQHPAEPGGESAGPGGVAIMGFDTEGHLRDLRARREPTDAPEFLDTARTRSFVVGPRSGSAPGGPVVVGVAPAGAAPECLVRFEAWTSPVEGCSTDADVVVLPWPGDATHLDHPVVTSRTEVLIGGLDGDPLRPGTIEARR
jgi:hypothetical protein